MAAPIQNQGQQQGQTGQMGDQPGMPKSQQGTGYTNLSTIMGANQGNQLGQAVAGGIENTGQQASSALNSGVQNFNQQSQANQLGTQAQQQYVQNTLGNLGIGANGQSTNPTSVTGPSSGDVSNFQQYMAGQYMGPSNIANISDIQNKAQNAQTQGQETGSSGGRQALLQQYAASPSTSYGSGAQNLDTALLGATGGTQLAQARQAVSGLNNQVNSAQAAAQQTAQQNTNQAQGFGQAVTGQVQGGVNAVYNPAQQTAQQANATDAANQAAEQLAAQNIGQGNYSQAALTALGLTAGQQTYGANSAIGSNAISYTPQNEQANALNVMTNPQYQQYSGLNQLLGQTTAAQGNPYQAGQTTYNQAAAQGDIAANQAILAPDQLALTNSQNMLHDEQVLANSGIGIDANNIAAKAQGIANNGAGSLNPQQAAAIQQLYSQYMGGLGGTGANAGAQNAAYAAAQNAAAQNNYNQLAANYNGVANLMS